MFSHSVDCLFILLMISFAVQKLFSLMKSYFFIFFLLFPLPGEIDTSDKNFLWVMSEILLHMFSSRIFMISDWTFKSLIHFEFIVVCGVRRWSSFIFLHVSVQFSQHHLLNKLSLAHYMCLFPCRTLIDYKGMGLFLGSLFCSIDLCVCFDYYGLTV